MKSELRAPLGRIIKISHAVNGSVVVGDYSSYLMITTGKIPRVIIRDNRIKRKRAPDEIKEVLDRFGKYVFMVKNPASTITDSAEIAVKLAVGSNKKCRIDVDGEEDLLALIAIESSADGSHVYYGQPNTGLVDVLVNKRTKSFVRGILKRMEEVS